MANQFAARKDGDYKVISMAPDVCLTPIGSSVLVNPNWTLLLENFQTLQVTDRH